MSALRVKVQRASSIDSVRLMAASRAMQAVDGVDWAAALMATDANCAELEREGFTPADFAGASSGDLVLAARAENAEDAEQALHDGLAALAPGATEPAQTSPRRIRTFNEAVARLPEANVAVVSVPGHYAALEAHKALSAGLHVLLFSDNVSIEDEVALKDRAARLGLLLMGPGAGTAALGGVGLGFANAVRRGPVGVVAAAGTGAQEVMTLLHRWGTGVSHVIGVGGRDLSADVAARMTSQAVRALEKDPDTEVLLVVSKPPAPDVAEQLLAQLGATPAVVALLGAEDHLRPSEGVTVARSLEGAVLATLGWLGVDLPSPGAGLAALAECAASRLPPERTAIRGLFSGGTLCSETLALVSERLGRVSSNIPIRPEWGLPAPEDGHVCLDLGEEEHTRGQPHPTLDPAARVDHIKRESSDPATAVVLLDVVLGYGTHENPASVLAPACAEAVKKGPAMIAYVLGTDDDPQDYGAQCAQLEEAGCLLAPSATRAALLAAAIAARAPGLAEEVP